MKTPSRKFTAGFQKTASSPEWFKNANLKIDWGKHKSYSKTGVRAMMARRGVK